MILIEAFKPTHQDAVVDLIVQIQRNEYHLPIEAKQQPDLFTIPTFYQVGQGEFLVAVHDGNVVGTAALKDIGDGKAALRKMFVAPEFRGRPHAVAAKLLHQLFESGEAKGVQTIFLGTTAQFIAAHRFYEKHGFSRISKEKLPHAFPLMAVDTVFYMRECRTACTCSNAQ